MKRMVLFVALAILLLGGAGNRATAGTYSPNKDAKNLATRPTAPLDVNTASLEELKQIPGMTEVWAGRIVRYRPYTTKLQLKTNGILPAEVYERVAPYLVAHRKPKP